MDSLAQIGRPLPDFSLPDLEGRRHSPGEARGRVLILNFWSAECPWSQRADELLVPWLAAWGERVTLWAVASNLNEPPQLLRRAAQQRGLRTVLLDRDCRVADLLGAVTTPHFFVADQEGVLRYQGPLDDATFRQRQPEHQYLHDAVEALLAGRPPAVSSAQPYGCAIVRHGPE